MLTRRRFLELTVVLAACAPISRVTALSQSSRTGTWATEAPPAPILWVPTQSEVDEWLKYYQLCVATRSLRFAEAVRTLFEDRGPVEPDLFTAAERSFDELQYDRSRVGFAQGLGYQNGREGLPRQNLRYTAPSNEAYAWYNGWVQGKLDHERRLKWTPQAGTVQPGGQLPRMIL